MSFPPGLPPNSTVSLDLSGNDLGSSSSSSSSSSSLSSSLSRLPSLLSLDLSRNGLSSLLPAVVHYKLEKLVRRWRLKKIKKRIFPGNSCVFLFSIAKLKKLLSISL